MLIIFSQQKDQQEKKMCICFVFFMRDVLSSSLGMLSSQSHVTVRWSQSDFSEPKEITFGSTNSVNICYLSCPSLYLFFFILLRVWLVTPMKENIHIKIVTVNKQDFSQEDCELDCQVCSTLNHFLIQKYVTPP